MPESVFFEGAKVVHPEGRKIESAIGFLRKPSSGGGEFAK